MKQLKSYVFITLALVVNSIGWGCFIIPAKIVGSGFIGLSTLVSFVTGLPIGPINIVLNGLLILAAMRIIGAQFGFKTVYCIVILSLFLDVWHAVLPSAPVDDRFLNAVIGGCIVGLSIGMLLSQGGSTGGTEIIAMIVNKYRAVRPGRVLMACDFIIIGLSSIYFQSLENLIYGYIVMIAMSLSTDYMLTGNKQCVQIFVISRKSKDLANKISERVNRGITFIKGQGYYTDEEREIIMMIVRKNEMHAVLRVVEEFDDKAFISVATVMGVFGEGFDKYKPAL